MKLKLCILLCLVANTFCEVLDEQNSEEIDPVEQTQYESEVNDQSKRFLLENNRYALEKHVKYHGGHKHLLGYRPVSLHYLPISKPLYKPRNYGYRPIKQGRPIVSLVPPKVHPVYKPYNSLPVNVPPNVPQNSWQTQGWNKPEEKPFLPSAPGPDPAVVPTYQPVQPDIPVPPTIPAPAPSVHTTFPKPLTNVFVTKPVFHATPIPPLPTPITPITPIHPLLHPVPLPTASFPGVISSPHPGILPAPLPSILPGPHADIVPTSLPVHPHPFPHFLQKPFVPINYLPGKIHVSPPDLGVLPLGSTVPVQLTPQFPNIVHKQVLVQEPVRPQVLVHEQPHLHVQEVHHGHGVFHHLPSVPNGIQLQGGFTPIEHPPPDAIFNHGRPPFQHSVIPNRLVPNVQIFPNSHPILHNSNPVFQNAHPISPSEPPVLQHSPIFPNTPLFQPVDGSPPIFHHQPPIPSNPSDGVIPNSVQDPGVQQQEPPRNYFYFARRLPNNNINNQIDFNQHQEVQHNINFEQSFVQPSHHQGVEESSGFFQPGKTDLQIPEYLPEHPHLRNVQQQQYQQSYEMQKR